MQEGREKNGVSPNYYVDYQIYKNMLRLYNYEICKTRETFFSDITSRNIDNARVLFSTVERLTNPPTDVTPELLSEHKCEEFASFFNCKIDKIRLNITTQLQTTRVLDLPATERGPKHQMSELDCINHETLIKTVQNLSSATSHLDTLPSSLFKSVLHLITT